MILDSLSTAQRYSGLHPKFGKAFEFLKTAATREPGEHELDDRSLYAIVTNGDVKLQNESFLEAHRRYIDIHFLIEGKERVGWRAVSRCRVIDKAYESEKDFLTFRDEPETFLELLPDEFAVFFPEDAHAARIADTPFRKVVVKVTV